MLGNQKHKITMEISTIIGHLTAHDKKAIKAMFQRGLKMAEFNGKAYVIARGDNMRENEYSVAIATKRTTAVSMFSLTCVNEKTE